MTRLILRQLGSGLIITLAVSLIIFLGTTVLPGDAAEIRMGQEATEENVAALRERLGLDRPLVLQYFSWLKNFVRGDLGVSLASDVPISDLIANRYENTLYVSVFAAFLSIPVSLTVGIWAAMYPRSILDRLVTLLSVSLIAVPEFFTATVLVVVFVSYLNIGNAVVVGGTEGLGVLGLLQHFALPVTVLSISISSQLIRMARAAVLNVMSAPYIEMAILKGLPRRRIILRHALPNAAGPILNVIALSLAYLVTGVIVVEVYFSYPGLATLIVQAVQTRDFVLIQALGMIFCMTYVVLMLLADVSATLSNPRLRHPK